MMAGGQWRLGGGKGTERARGLHVAVAREMRGVWGGLRVVLLLDKMKRRKRKVRKGKWIRGEDGEKLTVFFREKKDILLGLIDGMVGGVGKREGKGGRGGTRAKRRTVGLRFANRRSKAARHSRLQFPRLVIPANYRLFTRPLMISLTVHHHSLN